MPGNYFPYVGSNYFHVEFKNVSYEFPEDMKGHGRF